MRKLIGNTPMIKIKYKYIGKEKEVYVKLEQYNLTGSIKDRIALYIIEEEKKRNILKEKSLLLKQLVGIPAFHLLLSEPALVILSIFLCPIG